MSISANMHQVQKMKIYESGDVAWLKIEDGESNSFTIFMPHQTAKAIVDAWEAAQSRDEVTP